MNSTSNENTPSTPPPDMTDTQWMDYALDNVGAEQALANAAAGLLGPEIQGVHAKVTARVTTTDPKRFCEYIADGIRRGL